MEGIENSNQENKIPQEAIEEMERIAMEKVQDINAQGTAFHFLLLNYDHNRFDSNEDMLQNHLEQLSKCLKLGILSGKGLWKPVEEDVAEWKKRIRERSSSLYFNIVGRSCENIASSHFFGRDSEYVPAIIFDKNNFSEVMPSSSEVNSGETGNYHGKTHTYASNWYYANEKWQELFGDLSQGEEIKKHPNFKHALELGIVDESGLINGISEYGFALNFRVAPRFFEGIVLQYSSPKWVELFINLVKELYKQKPELSLPIYFIKKGENLKKDGHRDKNYNSLVELLWPKRMGPEELAEYLKQKSQQQVQSE